MRYLTQKLKRSRDERIEESMKSPQKIDISVDMRFPLSNSTNTKKYKCYMCGESWDSQKSHIEICNDCRDKYYKKLIDFYSGNEEHAIRHMCMEFGWVYHIDALTASRQISADRSRISHYLAKKNLGQTARIGTTYFDSMKFEFNEKQGEIVKSREQAKSEESTITATAVDRWGVGFTESDYKIMDEHYKMLKRQNPNCDANQEIFIKSLCSLLKRGDSDKYIKLTDQYSKTFTKAGLSTIQETDNSANECLGVTLATISQYTPEEYYKDKELYKDYDKIGEYFDRFVKRPLRNLMTGTTDRDTEYFVKDNADDVDE